MSNGTSNWREEKELPKVSCSSYDCQRDLHSFLRKRPRNESYRNESCVACGIELVDWQRLDRHDLSDAAYTIEALEHEMFRHHYWHKNLDHKAVNHAARKGIEGLREAAIKRIRKYVGPPREEIFRDGIQTPLNGNAIYYGQHATATCCRRCVEAWQGIDRNRALTDEEVGYMSNLVMLYIIW